MQRVDARASLCVRTSRRRHRARAAGRHARYAAARGADEVKYFFLHGIIISQPLLVLRMIFLKVSLIDDEYKIFPNFYGIKQWKHKKVGSKQLKFSMETRGIRKYFCKKSTRSCKMHSQEPHTIMIFMGP